MTNEEAKMFLDNLKICINEHPIVADWLAEIADRKTENSSENPNNSTISKMEQVDKDINVRSKDCETCKHYKLACELFSEVCKYEPITQTETQNSNLTFEKRTMRDCYNCKRYETEGECVECHYEPKDEPTISKMEQVEDEFKQFDREDLILLIECQKERIAELLAKDEPQTEEHCNTCRHKDECEGATYEYKNTEWWCLAYVPMDEPQTEQVGVPFGEMDEATFKSHCLNCQRDTADIKCLDCDGNKYFLSYGSETDCAWK